MAVRYGAELVNGAYLMALASPAFDFGTGDFTVTATLMTTSGCPVVTRRATGGAGWALSIDASGIVTFLTSDGGNLFAASSPQPQLLDGACHVLAGVRSGGALTLFVDGIEAASTSGPAVDVDNDLALSLGATQDTSAPFPRMTGMLLDVSVWATALSGAALDAATFGRVSGAEPGLRGAWSLNYTTADMSPFQNPANMVGPVLFMACISCVWAAGGNDFAFVRMGNNPNADEATAAGAMTLTQSRPVVVPAGAPALAVSIMAAADAPAFPAGVTLSITDPQGTRYSNDVNTPTLFVATSGGQPWALLAVDPLPGSWTIEVTAPSTAAFFVDVQVVPSADVVTTVEAALAPLYGTPALCRELHDTALLGGWLDVLTKVAVAALVGVTVAGLVVFSGGAALPAVAAGLAAFAAVTIGEAETMLPDVSTTSLPLASGGVAGLAGFVVAVDRLLLVDANVDADPATQLIYKRRDKVLYPYVTLSPFSRNQASLVADQDTRANVAAQLSGFTSGFATMSGHGMAFYLTGWYLTPNGPLQEVLTTGRYAPAEAAGKIFHMFACNCGYSGASPGLGIDLVNHGAVAFFGYSEPFQLPPAEYIVFCDCDIEIDKALIDGDDCATAYQRARAKYTAAISRYIANGDTLSAARLQANLNVLVAPSTNAAYGNPAARLQIT